MKTLKITTMLFILLISNMSFAQEQDSSIIDILSLEECMTLAVQNAPELKATKAFVVQAKAAEEIAGTNILIDHLSITGNSHYVYRRHFDIPYDKDGFNDPLTNQPTFFGPQWNNTIGLTLNMPLNSFKLKKENKRMAAAVVEETQGTHEAQIMVVQREVIILYKQFEQASSRVNSAADNLEAQKSALTVAEDDFKNGVIDVEKYSNVKQSQINALDAFTDSRAALEIAYNELKLRVGIEIIK